MEYEDFIVGIGPRVGDGYAVQVRSPAGEGRGVFRLPFNLDELSVFTSGTWLARQTVRRRGGASSPRNLAPRYAPLLGLTAERLGGQLFRALFSGEVKSLFHESLGQIEKLPDRGLRIRIEIDPRDPLLARLYGLPWELLYRDDTDDFLGLRRMTPLVRCLPIHRAPRPLRCSQIRVLIVTANPAGTPPLQLKKEHRELKAAWGHPGRVRFEILEQANPEKLRRALLQGEFHVLHFMGHGEFSEADGEGVLLFEADDRAPRPVSGRSLAVQLKDFKSLRLVILNACETGKAASTSGLNPFAGVATALALGGVPAVVAMQAPIPDDAAVAFSRTFYQRLAAGESVDAAFTEARLSIHQLNDKAVDWAIPLLLLRSRDGKLFTEASFPRLARRGIAAGLIPLLLGAALSLRLAADKPQTASIKGPASAPAPPRQRTFASRSVLPHSLQEDGSATEPQDPLVSDLAGEGGEPAEAGDPFWQGEGQEDPLASDLSSSDLMAGTEPTTPPGTVKMLREYLYTGSDWPTVMIESVESAAGTMLAHFSVRNHFEEEVVVSLDDPQDSTYMLDSQGYAYNFAQASGIDASNGLSLRPGENASFTILFKGPEASPLRTFSVRMALKARGSRFYGKRDLSVKTITIAGPAAQ